MNDHATIFPTLLGWISTIFANVVLRVNNAATVFTNVENWLNDHAIFYASLIDWPHIKSNDWFYWTD
ncbi:MAG: hypothetical protein ACJ0BJ_13325 [Pirellulales bacterium]